MRLGKRLACLAMGAALCVGPLAVRAQVLAERVPADALVYVGWRGTSDLGPNYAKSNLKGLLDHTNLREQVATLIARGMEDAAKGDAKKAQDAKQAKVLIDALCKYPSAFYFGGLDLTDATQPQPKIAIVSEAGGEAQALADMLNKSIADNPDKKTPAEAKVFGKYVLLKIGKPEGVDALLGNAEGKNGSLAGNKEFVAAMGQVQKGAVVTAYVSMHGVLQLIGDASAQKGPPQAAQNWAKAVDALNLNAFEDLIWTGEFDGKDWAGQGFVAIDKSQFGGGKGWTGLASLLDHPPLSDEALKMVPKSAAWAGVVRFDAARLLTEIRDMADRAAENGGRQFDMVLQQAPNFIGVDAKDLCGSLGDEWVYYGSAEAVGNSLRGATVVNHLRNEKSALADLQDLEDFVNGKMGQRPGAPAWTSTKVTSKVEGVGELEIHSLALPQMTPSWTVAGGNLVISMSPQGVQSAVEGLAKKAPSIADNPDFVALRKKLEGTAKMTSFSYADLNKTAPEAFEFINLLNAAIAEKAGDKGLAFVFPSLDQIKPYLSPAASVYWTDDMGWHMRSVAPFPGATALGGEQLLMEMAAGKMGERAKARGGVRRGPGTRPATGPADPALR